jgi:hypothetical protein
VFDSLFLQRNLIDVENFLRNLETHAKKVMVHHPLLRRNNDRY